MKKRAIKNALSGLVGVALAVFVASPVAWADSHVIRPAEGTNLEEKFQHQILYRALEEMGYQVAEPSETSYQALHLAIGSGDADFTAVHWDPLHHAFFEESGGEAKMSKVGDYIQGALQGYLVDKKAYDAGVRNLGDLKKADVVALFDRDKDGKADLAGCPPGWGCERVIEHHLDEFGLHDTVNHNQGDYNAVIADSIAAFKSGQHIIYYTWTPYWVSGILVPGRDVEWIEVPYSSLPDGREASTMYNNQELGFEVNSLRVVARNDFLAENPAVNKLFEVAKLDINDVSAQNRKMHDGEDSIEDIERHVAEWIAANRSTFDSWVNQAKAAQ